MAFEETLNRFRRRVLWSAIGLLLALSVMVTALPFRASADEEVASAIRRYKEYEQSTGYYEEYEVKPRHRRPWVEVPGVGRGIFPYSPTGAPVRIRTRLADAHSGIKFYKNLRCEDCHIEQTKDIHTVRANLTCRQCHGGEPIAGIQHYYSSMNPIRRHAYVCSKCHEGSSASFASYVVHSPNPALLSTRETFPLLFYAFWFMVALSVSTFAAFLPLTALWGLRELLAKKETLRGGYKGKD